MSEEKPLQAAFLDAWLEQNLSIEEVQNELKKLFSSEEEVSGYLTAFKKKRQENRSRKGLFFMILGAILGFISCVLTLTDLFPDLREVIMVGLTSVAISIAVLGCYFVFE